MSPSQKLFVAALAVMATGGAVALYGKVERKKGALTGGSVLIALPPFLLFGYLFVTSGGPALLNVNF